MYMIPAQHVSVIHAQRHITWALTAGAIEGESYCEFSNPVASALKPFSNPHSYCVFSDPIHGVTEPAPLDENRNISLFSGNLYYSGTVTQSTLFWAFMTIRNSKGSWGNAKTFEFGHKKDGYRDSWLNLWWRLLEAPTIAYQTYQTVSQKFISFGRRS